MAGTGDDVQLLFLGQVDELNGITGNTDGEVGVLFLLRVLHSVDQLLGAETHGLLASLNSVAKLPYHWALDGISNTQTINPDALGHSEDERVTNLVQVMDGYFDQGAHHLNG